MISCRERIKKKLSDVCFTIDDQMMRSKTRLSEMSCDDIDGLYGNYPTHWKICVFIDSKPVRCILQDHLSTPRYKSSIVSLDKRLPSKKVGFTLSALYLNTQKMCSTSIRE